ncbi:hypothetical protein DFH09DRAFT_1310447 [Mycena vulgaris]|nr:hypothetical protein DFH09DRAFT_1310447 [Mycena vulgaris]
MAVVSGARAAAPAQTQRVRVMESAACNEALRCRLGRAAEARSFATLPRTPYAPAHSILRPSSTHRPARSVKRSTPHNRTAKPSSGVPQPRGAPGPAARPVEAHSTSYSGSCAKIRGPCKRSTTLEDGGTAHPILVITTPHPSLSPPSRSALDLRHQSAHAPIAVSREFTRHRELGPRAQPATLEEYHDRGAGLDRRRTAHGYGVALASVRCTPSPYCCGDPTPAHLGARLHVCYAPPRCSTTKERALADKRTLPIARDPDYPSLHLPLFAHDAAASSTRTAAAKHTSISNEERRVDDAHLQEASRIVPAWIERARALDVRRQQKDALSAAWLHATLCASALDLGARGESGGLQLVDVQRARLLECLCLCCCTGYVVGADAAAGVAAVFLRGIRRRRPPLLLCEYVAHLGRAGRRARTTAADAYGAAAGLTNARSQTACTRTIDTGCCVGA